MGTVSSYLIASIIFTIISLIILVLPVFLLSRLTKIEHDDFHDQWEKDGKPHGMPFWFPLNDMFSLGFRSYPWFKGTWWLFKTPEWTKNHEKATNALRYYRIGSFFIYSSLIGVFLLLVL
jgi:hypothetical protein